MLRNPVPLEPLEELRPRVPAALAARRRLRRCGFDARAHGRRVGLHHVVQALRRVRIITLEGRVEGGFGLERLDAYRRDVRAVDAPGLRVSLVEFDGADTNTGSAAVEEEDEEVEDDEEEDTAAQLSRFFRRNVPMAKAKTNGKTKSQS